MLKVGQGQVALGAVFNTLRRKKKQTKKKKKLTNSGDQCIKSVFTDKMTSKGIHKAYAKILQMSNH